MPDARTFRTPPSVRLIVLLYVLFMTFHAFDAWSTVEAVRNGAVELNPAMAWLLRHGFTAFVVGKMAIAAVGGLVLALTSRRWRLGWYGLVGLTVLYGVVAVWHSAIIMFGERLVITIPA
jgi:hypothetical protein